MKIILSRKGFDSAQGRVPSPILPSGELCSLPIPSGESGIRYLDICSGDASLADYVEALTGGRIKADEGAHLDPDLCPVSLERECGWRPLFGQSGAAQGHLSKMGVGRGDIFLFFGWFRCTQFIDGKLAYVKNAPDLHVLFGWLQVGDMWSAKERHLVPAWAKYHPHLSRDNAHSNDTIYVAADHLELPGLGEPTPGAGLFPRYSPELCLTAPDCSRSAWKLPGWFHPGDRKSSLSYHAAASRWGRAGEELLLRCVGRGQEFVLDCDDYPESVAWVRELLCSANR